MKRLISAALIASTLALTVGATAASAQPYGRHGGYSRGWNGGGYRHHDNTGALVGLGIGLFALGAIAAASANHDRYDRYDDRYDYGAPSYRYGYGNGYGYGNSYGYGNRYGYGY